MYPDTSLFTLKKSPGTWWSKLQRVVEGQLIDRAVYQIQNREDSPAAKLLLVIMMSSIHVDLAREAMDMDLSERDQF
jgi:hypothetical protein